MIALPPLVGAPAAVSTAVPPVSARAVVATGTAPAPSFSIQPSIAGTAQVGQVLTGMDGTISNGTVVSRRWLLGAAVVSTAQSYAATTAGALVYEVTARGPGGTTIAASAVATVAAGSSPGVVPSFAQFTEGYNQEGACYYIPIPIHNDWGRYCQVDTTNIYIPYAGIPGPTIVESYAHLTGASHATMQNLASAGANKWSFTISGDCFDTDTRYFTYTGSAPTYFRVTRVGRVGKWSQEALAGYEGRGWRDLDQGYQNRVALGPRVDTAPVDAPFYTFTDKGCLLPVEDRADFLAAKMAVDPNFFFLWHVIPGNWSLADVRQGAIAFRDRCPTNAAFILQDMNEDPWNTDFVGVRTSMIRAFAEGHYGASVWNNPLPPIIISADCGHAKAGNTSSPATPIGGRVLFDLEGTTGNSVWKAKQAVPAGAEINENAYWTREYDGTAVKTAQRKWRMRFLYDITQVYRDVFGPARYAAQIFPCVMGQHATTGEIYNQLATERTYIPGFFDGSATQTVRIAGCAGYLDEGDIGRANFDYANATPASIEAGIRAAFVSYKMRIRQYVADCATMGVIPGFYELSIAPNLPNTAAYTASYASLMRSDAGRQLLSDFGQFWRSTLAITMFYDATGDKIGVNPSTAFNDYSLRTTWADTSNPRYVGWKQGIAITPPPPGATGFRYYKVELTTDVSGNSGASSFVSLLELDLLNGANVLSKASWTVTDNGGCFAGAGFTQAIDGDDTTNLFTNGTKVVTGIIDTGARTTASAIRLRSIGDTKPDGTANPYGYTTLGLFRVWGSQDKAEYTLLFDNVVSSPVSYTPDYHTRGATAVAPLASG